VGHSVRPLAHQPLSLRGSRILLCILCLLLVVFHTPAPQLGSARKHIPLYHLFFFGRYDKGTVVKVLRQVV
jgi:hypothetical protein